MRILDLRWSVFEYHNHNTSNDFEDMCRRLFTAKYLENKVIPHTEHNTPGIEVLPALEVEHDDGQPQKLISFQAKYCNNVTDAYKFFLNSAKITVDKWQGKLDVVYLFCNKTLTTRSKSYSKIVDTLKNAGIEAIPISNNDLLDLVEQYPRIANYYFGNDPSSQNARKTEKKYLEMMQKTPFSKELCTKTLAEIYVANEYRISKEGEEKDDLLSLIDSFIEERLLEYLSSKKEIITTGNQLDQTINTLIITAEQCVGKSTLIGKIIHNYANDFSKDYQVYVANYRDNALKSKDIDIDSICSYLGINLEENSKSIIILDGIDESDMSSSQIQDGIERLSYQLLDNEYNALLIITCRDNTLDIALNNCLTITLCPFSDNKIEKWISLCDFNMDTGVLNRFFNDWINAPIHIRAPYFFKICIEMGLKLTEINGLGQLYDKAFLSDGILLYSMYDNQRMPRLSTHEVGIMKELILKVAYKSIYSDDKSISEDELLQLIHSNEEGAKIKEFIYQFFLSSQDGKYRFIHDSLLYYFFAYIIYERLCKINEKENEENKEEEMASFILEFVKKGTHFSKDIYGYLQHHIETHEKRLTIAFADKYIKKYLSHEFDKYIRIEGTYEDIKTLYYACFVFVVSIFAAIIKADAENAQYDLLANLDSKELSQLIDLSRLGNEALSIIDVFSFNGKDLDGFNLTEFDFTRGGSNAKAIRNASFKASNFNHATLKGCYLINSDLTLSTFFEAKCEVLQAHNCVMSGCDFSKAKLDGALFENCDLSNADFRGARLRKTSFAGSDITGIKINVEQLTDLLDLFPDEIRRYRIAIYKGGIRISNELMENEFKAQRPVAYLLYLHRVSSFRDGIKKRSLTGRMDDTK